MTVTQTVLNEHTEKAIMARHTERLAAIVQRYSPDGELSYAEVMLLPQARQDLKDAAEAHRMDWVRAGEAFKKGERKSSNVVDATNKPEPVIQAGPVPESVVTIPPTEPSVFFCTAMGARANGIACRCRVRGADHTDHRWWNKNGEVVTWKA